MNSDKPIKDENEDLLGFSLPAYKLAEAIIGYKEKETFVISIEGEWGSGKTSFMKLVENKLENEAIIVHFNPWAIVDFEQLTRYFFDELINTINYNLFSAKLTADAKAAVKGLQKFAAFLAPDEISHFGFTYKVKERLSPKKEQKTMYKLKNGINENLRKMDKKIVIIIDDIDRLMDKETETLFRLIKGIADFDNIIYILLYDKTIVGKSLEKFKGEKGEKYLDKIVQYPIIVPKPHAGVLEGLLFKELDEILDEVHKKHKECPFDDHRWGNIRECISKYIKNIRDVKKIVSVIDFEYPLVCENVNFTDFFAISLIKIHDIELYNSIKNKPELYFYFANIRGGEEESTKRIQGTLGKEKWFSHHEKLLSSIVPALDGYGTWTKPHKNKYLADGDYFNNYFSFTIPLGAISVSEYIKIKNLMTSENYEEFQKKICKLDNNNKSKLFVYMFTQKELDGIEFSDIELYNAIVNILTVSNLVKEGVYAEAMGITDVNPKYIYRNFAFNIMSKCRNKVFIDKIFDNKNIYIYDKAYILFHVKKQHLEDKFIKDEYFNILNQKVKSELEKLSLKDIIAAKDDGTELLLTLKEYKLLDTISMELNNKIFKSKKDFFETLDIFKYWQQSSSGNRYELDKNFMKEFFDFDKIDEYIKNLKKLTESEKELLEMWKYSGKW